MKYAYHSSPVHNLKKIKAKENMDKGKYVFASPFLEVSAAFLGRAGGDFTCSIGKDIDNKLYICERFDGALKHRYGVSGSIYYLDSKNFKTDEKLWWGEVVSNKDEIVKKEIVVDNALSFLYNLEKEGKINIYKYPNRPNRLPGDDSDLVKRAVIWSKTLDKNKTLDMVKKYHPNLLDRVLEELRLIKN